jgi:hypothetical protein
MTAEAGIHHERAKRRASRRRSASTITVAAVRPSSPSQGEKTIELQLSFEMPCRRDHQAAARSNGSETAQRTVMATTPVMIPALTGPRPSERASRGPRRTSTTRVTISATVPSSQT